MLNRWLQWWWKRTHWLRWKFHDVHYRFSLGKSNAHNLWKADENDAISCLAPTIAFIKLYIACIALQWTHFSLKKACYINTWKSRNVLLPPWCWLAGCCAALASLVICSCQIIWIWQFVQNIKLKKLKKNLKKKWNILFSSCVFHEELSSQKWDRVSNIWQI